MKSVLSMTYAIFSLNDNSQKTVATVAQHYAIGAACIPRIRQATFGKDQNLGAAFSIHLDVQTTVAVFIES
jgi:hypothetical protein